MYRIIDDRGTGKTSRLMLIAKENNAYFVCADPYAMRYKAECYGITGINFISYAEFYNHYKDYKKTPVVIDEIEGYIRRCYPQVDILGYTMSLE